LLYLGDATSQKAVKRIVVRPIAPMARSNGSAYARSNGSATARLNSSAYGAVEQ
jgi:hypothetical protein